MEQQEHLQTLREAEQQMHIQNQREDQERTLESKRNSKRRSYQVAIDCCLSISSLVTVNEISFTVRDEFLCSSLLLRGSGQAAQQDIMVTAGKGVYGKIKPKC